jgi:Na+/H+ antiporter NhaD/arsenite permease-like protein
MDPHVQVMFGMFILMLVGLLLFHTKKTQVVAIGFAALSIGFMVENGGGLNTLGLHFAVPHRFHLLFNLALLLPAFGLVAYEFEHSGASNFLAKFLKSDMALLWAIFWLSTVLDNIAAAMIGATILRAKYGMEASPFKMIIAVICASNLGGAGSPVGDTTTIMMFISEKPKIGVVEIFKAFFATLPAQFLINIWAKNHQVSPRDFSGEDSKVEWRAMLPMLAIPGLVIGNFLNQPGLGVWAGLMLGLILGMKKLNVVELWKAVPNTVFLVLLVGAAEMLPLEEIKPDLDALPRTGVAILMGLLSAWFDNIPLTSICLNLGGFDWGLLAYCVGFGGSAMWFGSSAGVATGLIFPEVYNTKKWVKPFFVVTGIYLVGCVAYLMINTLMKGVMP